MSSQPIIQINAADAVLRTKRFHVLIECDITCGYANRNSFVKLTTPDKKKNIVLASESAFLLQAFLGKCPV